ncbi:MAG: tRNA 2-thiocytidine(32) synthetase TtcA, partial [Leptospiraceae bacterium]|nr:tRNA 2-thiocytidine(32) synthetase TtcA [Leptospiraceae bacterium]
LMEFDMIADGDRILVAVSGGKDSLCMLHFLELYRRKAPVRFDIIAVNLDQGQPDYPDHILPALFQDWNENYHIEKQDTYSTVLEKTPPGGTFCSICSRLRRGILYRLAREQGCNTIALGHHRDDLIQTFLMNAFFSGKLGTMPPRYLVEEGDLTVIRPLASVPEDWIRAYVTAAGWSIVPCNLCGSQDGLKRAEMRKLLDSLQSRFPEIKNSLFAALANPHRNELLDRTLWTDPEIAVRR